MQKKIFEKRLFAYEIRFAVEKQTKKFLGQIFKITLCRHQKKCQSYTFHIWELYDKHFFQKKNENLSFYHQTVLLESNSHRNEFIPVFNHF